MIEWIFKHDIGKVKYSNSMEIITVGDQLLKMFRRENTMEIFYLDFDTMQWCPFPQNIYQPAMNEMLSFSSNSENLYMFKQEKRGDPCSFWMLDMAEPKWTEVIGNLGITDDPYYGANPFAYNMMSVEWYFFKQQLYIIRRSGSFEKFHSESQTFEELHDFEDQLTTMKFFEYEEKLWILLCCKNSNLTKLYYLENEELIFFHVEVSLNIFFGLCLGISGNCLKVFHNNQKHTKVCSMIFHFDTKKWENNYIKRGKSLEYSTSIHYIDKKVYCICRDYQNNYYIYIGMDTGNLELQSLLKIRNNYKKRMENGESMSKLIADIDRLIVPDKLKKDIQNSTVWKLDLTRRKLRRKLRREMLKKMNDPNFVKSTEVSDDDKDEVFDLISDKNIDIDSTLLWNYNYPIEQPNEFCDLSRTVVVGDKIWVLNGREIGKSYQIYCFNTKTDSWKRIFYKNEEIFGDEMWENVDDTRKDIIPMATRSYSVTSCEAKIYLWSFKHFSPCELYEFDTETLEWNKLTVPAGINDCYQFFGLKNQLYFSQISRETIDLQILDMKTNQLSSIILERNPLKRISKIHISGDKLFVISGDRELYEIADGKFKNVETKQSALPEKVKLHKTFSNEKNIFQIWENKETTILNVLDIHTLEWKMMKVEKIPSNDLYQSIFAINDCLYVTWQERKKMGGGVYKLELNPSINTKYLINLADKDTSEQELNKLSRKMRRGYTNIVDFRKKKVKMLADRKKRESEWSDSEVDDFVSHHHYEILDRLDSD